MDMLMQFTTFMLNVNISQDQIDTNLTNQEMLNMMNFLKGKDTDTKCKVDVVNVSFLTNN